MNPPAQTVKDTLKLGLMLDSFEVPAWVGNSIERITRLENVRLEVILFVEVPHPLAQTRWGGHRVTRRREWLYRKLNQMDERFFLRAPKAFQSVSVEKMLSGIPFITVHPEQEENFDYFPSNALDPISEYKFDILVYLGSRPLQGDFSQVAKYGVWFYDHSDGRVFRGSPPGFWEVVEKAPLTEVLLVAKGGRLGNRTLYRSSFLTYPFSPARNRDVQHWASASFLARQISLLTRLGEQEFLDQLSRFNDGFEFSDHPLRQIPANLESLKCYLKLFVVDIAEIFARRFQLDTWYLMYKFFPGSTLAFGEFQKMIPPKDRFWADPQVVERDGIFYIFVEELFYKNGKGHISVIEMDAGGQYKPAVPVLVCDYHLSYPYIFEKDGTYYMVPESAQNGTIDLYESIEFPRHWKFKMSLMRNVKAFDTTLIERDGKWWLFTGLAENEGACPEVELFLFWADELCTEDWHSHPLNPLISDASTARPAGKFFMKDGKLFRPSQNCSGIYGYGFNINEVVTLTTEDYCEKKAAAVKPNWEPRLIGTHTFTISGSFIIIDGLTRRSKL